jgi:hypothetical protein
VISSDYFYCMRWVVLVSFLAALVWLSPGCKKDVPTFECGTDIVSFEDDISPIFEQSCYVGGGDIGCHSAWIFNWSGIDGYDYWDKVRRSVITDCDMPPEENDFGFQPLTEDEIHLVYCWFEQGAINN